MRTKIDHKNQILLKDGISHFTQKEFLKLHSINVITFWSIFIHDKKSKNLSKDLKKNNAPMQFKFFEL